MTKENTYCLKEKKNTGNINIQYITLSNGITKGRKLMISICSSCGSKKSTFV